MNNIVENFQENFFIHASISFIYKSFYKQKKKIYIYIYFIYKYLVENLNPHFQTHQQAF